MLNQKKKIQLNLFAKQKQTYRGKTYGGEKGEEEGVGWEFEINIHTLLHIK